MYFKDDQWFDPKIKNRVSSINDILDQVRDHNMLTPQDYNDMIKLVGEAFGKLEDLENYLVVEHDVMIGG